MTVDEMLKGIAMASGNDASVAMAEKLAGSEQAFVEMMNAKVQQLGLKDTHFANCNGLPVENHYSSAHDIAVMSRELLKYPQITKYTGAYQDYLRKSSVKPFWLVNTNKLVRFYTGADGLKTGYTAEAKFCLSATAKRDGLRVVAVVLGEPNTKIRNNEVSSMFDYAFSQYTMKSIYKPGELLGSVKVEKGVLPELKIQADRSYSVLVKKVATNKRCVMNCNWPQASKLLSGLVIQLVSWSSIRMDNGLRSLISLRLWLSRRPDGGNCLNVPCRTYFLCRFYGVFF